MVKARVRVKEPHPLQKPWVSLRFRMVRSGQGRQRLKTFFLLNKARKEPLLPSAKIRSGWRSHQIFGATALGPPFGAVCHAREGLDFPSPVPSVLARLLLERYLLDCCQSRYGIWNPCFFLSSITSTIQTCLAAAKVRLGTRCLCFFFFSITGAIQTCLVIAGARLWNRCLCFFFSSIIGAIQTCLVAVRAKSKDLLSPCIPFLFFFFSFFIVSL